MGVECSDLCRCVGCKNDIGHHKHQHSDQHVSKTNMDESSYAVNDSSMSQDYAYEKPESRRDSYLGKRKRPLGLTDIPESKINNEIVIPYTPNENTYSLKPRKAKENRYLQFNDYSIELLDGKI